MVYSVLKKVLPVGLVFRFDFGFIPSTLAPDGDPLDAIVLSEMGLPATTVVLARVRIIKYKQTEKGRAERNDRIVVLPLDAKSRKPMQPAVKFDRAPEDAISRFLWNTTSCRGKRQSHGCRRPTRGDRYHSQRRPDEGSPPHLRISVSNAYVDDRIAAGASRTRRLAA